MLSDGFSYSLEFILEGIGEFAETAGNYGGRIRGFASLAEAKEGDLFFYSEQYKKDLENSQASIIIVPKDTPLSPSQGSYC